MSLGSSARTQAESPWGPGMSVEFLLLEHARIADEVQAGGGPSDFDMPRALDRGQSGGELLLAECDGASTMLEIADRLGWPLRQCCGVVFELVKHGAVRLATPREILSAALTEIEQGHYERAADRIEGWIANTPGGPPSSEDGELLAHLWERGQLASTLGYLRRRRGRTLCKKLDHVAADLSQSISVWERFCELHPSDGAARLHLTRQSLAYATANGYDATTVNELLRQARQLTDSGFALRSRALLGALAGVEIENLSTRIDVGHRMLAAGMSEQAGELLVAAATELVDSGDLVRARRLIGSLLVEFPENRAARDLLAEVDLRQRRKKRRFWQFAVAASTAVVLSGVGIVKYEEQRELERNVDAITALLDRPDDGLALLHESYPGVKPDRILALESTLERRRTEEQNAKVAAWNGQCDEIEAAIGRGDLVGAVEKIVGLGETPALDPIQTRQLRPREELLSLIAGKLQHRFDTSDPGLDAEREAIDAEGELLRETQAILEASRSRRLHSSFRDFVDHVEVLVMKWNERRSKRADERRVKEVRDREALQDRLLGSARFLAESGELEKSLATYEQLLQTDTNEAVAEFVTKERDGVAKQFDAWKRALEHASAGRHEDAIAVMKAAKLDPAIYELPWRVETLPAGAKVTMADGSVFTTPFVAHSRADRPVEFDVELAGTEPMHVTVATPADQLVHLHRVPERVVGDDHRFDALPILVGGDVLTADRVGNVKRVAKDGTLRWSIVLPTLGGVARTPRFLPARPGWLLVVSEEGSCWLVCVDDGAIEGPWDSGSPAARPENLGARSPSCSTTAASRPGRSRWNRSSARRRVSSTPSPTRSRSTASASRTWSRCAPTPRATRCSATRGTRGASRSSTTATT
ncbi:MAG: hypothetical protein R3F34_00410 [Planctomycetota bacterium]